MSRSVSEIRDNLIYKEQLVEEEEAGVIPGLTATDYKLQKYQTEERQKSQARGRETKRKQKLAEKEEHGEQEEQHVDTLELEQQRDSVGGTEQANHGDVQDSERGSEDVVPAADRPTKLPELGHNQRTKDRARRAAASDEKH